MKPKFFIFHIVFIINIFTCISQPGAYGKDVYLKLVDENNIPITPSDRSYEVKWVCKVSILQNSIKWVFRLDTLSLNTSIREDRVHHMRSTFLFQDSVYVINVVKTPGGGSILSGDHFYIVKNDTDTMRLYPPVRIFGSTVLLDNVRFRKGDFAIPDLVYRFHESLKPEKRRLFHPNLIDDWELFRLENKAVLYKRKVYAECIELFEHPNIISSLLPDNCNGSNRGYEDNEWFLNEYFINYNRFGYLVGSRGYLRDRDFPNIIPYYWFGVFQNTNIFLYQQTKGGAIDYGYIELPMDTEGKQVEDEYGTRFTNLDEYINLSIQYYNDFSYVLGHYNGKKLYDESFGRVKEMWGIFELYIDSVSDEKLKEMSIKHARQNNLYISNEEALRVAKKQEQVKTR